MMNENSSTTKKSFIKCSCYSERWYRVSVTDSSKSPATTSEYAKYEGNAGYSFLNSYGFLMDS